MNAIEVQPGDVVAVTFRAGAGRGKRCTVRRATVERVTAHGLQVGTWRLGVATFAEPNPPDVWHVLTLAWRDLLGCEVTG